MAVGGAITVGIIFYIAFMVGLCVLFVWACKKIAEGKGLPSSYMWFGLLGVIGLIVVAIIPDRRQQQNNYYGYQQYPQNSYGQPNQYGQNPYGQPNQYGQNIYNQNMNQQGYTLNGQQYSSMHNVTTCSKCGASMSGDSDFCPFCGTKVK